MASAKIAEWCASNMEHWRKEMADEDLMLPPAVVALFKDVAVLDKEAMFCLAAHHRLFDTSFDDLAIDDKVTVVRWWTMKWLAEPTSEPVPFGPVLSEANAKAYKMLVVKGIKERLDAVQDLLACGETSNAEAKLADLLTAPVAIRRIHCNEYTCYDYGKDISSLKHVITADWSKRRGHVNFAATAVRQELIRIASTVDVDVLDRVLMHLLGSL